MYETLVAEFEDLFPKRAFLTKAEICEVLSCLPRVVESWCERTDPARRPPRLVIGREVRFPKRDFVKWLVREQSAAGTSQAASP